MLIGWDSQGIRKDVSFYLVDNEGGYIDSQEFEKRWIKYASWCFMRKYSDKDVDHSELELCRHRGIERHFE